MNAAKILFVAQQTIPINPSLDFSKERGEEKKKKTSAILLSSKKNVQKHSFGSNKDGFYVLVYSKKLKVLFFYYTDVLALSHF